MSTAIATSTKPTCRRLRTLRRRLKTARRRQRESRRTPRLWLAGTMTGAGSELGHVQGRAFTPATIGAGPTALGPIFLDFETRSLAKLKVCGGRRYAEDASTEVLCMVARLPDGTFLVWKRGDPPPFALFDAIAVGCPIVAHNGGKFDRFVWKRLGWPKAVWIDTVELAMIAGLPRSLDDIAAELLGKEKDREGRKLTLRLSRPTKRGKLPDITAADLDRVVDYCRTDVELLAEIWHVRLGSLVDVEADVRALDLKINELGIYFDGELAVALIDYEHVATTTLLEETGIELATVRSPKKLTAGLAEHGVTVSNIKKATLEALTRDDDLPDPAHDLIDARTASAGIASHKLNTALYRISDGFRIQDWSFFHTAHTGRWSAGGFQPQNLPKGVSVGLEIEAVIKLVLARDFEQLRSVERRLDVSARDIIATLVRSCICAPPGRSLGVADFASIEPAVLAWCVGDRTVLDLLRTGGDLYRPMAAKLFGVGVDAVTKAQRNSAKPVVLGCGYGMGAEPRFRAYAEGFGVDWSTMPMSPTEVVEMWRDTNPLIAGERFYGRRRRLGGLWQRLEDAALRACSGERVLVGPTAWERNGDDVVCVLPSGRRMVYRSARVETVLSPHGFASESMTYSKYEQGRVVRAKTYGGLLTENIVQAIARDVLVDAMLKLDRADFEIVLHVHDEIVAEIDDVARFDEMKRIMSIPPAWAPDLPLRVEGYAEARYRK